MKIIYEDGDICVIEKPSGIIVNNSNSSGENTIQNWFKDKLELRTSNLEFISKGGIVHRLDKDASGVLVLAKNETAYEKLKEQFVNRRVDKTYLVLVHGRLSEKEGILSTPIERNPNKKTHFYVGKDLSKTGITAWKVREENDKYSFLDVNILTGRTHQIRVHMKHIGHPVFADELYAGRKTARADRKLLFRHFLHASKITFKHPTTGESMEFESDLPKDLSDLLSTLSSG